jgi:hypothetical protein
MMKSTSDRYGNLAFLPVVVEGHHSARLRAPGSVRQPANEQDQEKEETGLT